MIQLLDADFPGTSVIKTATCVHLELVTGINNNNKKKGHLSNKVLQHFVSIASECRIRWSWAGLKT